MTLWLMVRRSLRQHALSTLVTAFCIALAGGLLMSVWAVKDQAKAAFAGINGGFDAVIGRGSKLQLVLNAVFQMEASPGNLTAADYQAIKSNPAIALAVPIAVGDNYHGWRLVGTTPAMFNVEYTPGKHYELEPGGAFFEGNEHKAVVGSFAAQKTGLKLGDSFHPYHGLIFNENDQHSETYVVAGILKPSNTPADRVIYIPVEGAQKMPGHDVKTEDELSAVLVKLRGGPMAAFQLGALFNRPDSHLTFAWPIATIITELFDKIGWFDKVLALVAYLVAVVAVASILAAIYNSMNERRREIAILRALGARRRTLFAAIVLEATAISALGMAAGFGFYAVILLAVAKIVRAQTGIVLEPWQFNHVMLWAPGLLIGFGALAGIIPAVKAYRTDVATYLAPTS